jgi:uncharacterized protein YecE (DUF72 family)
MTGVGLRHLMIWIGTSGWVYPHWIGRFYPRELREPAWLAYYASRFATVEINRSFYRLPDREQFTAWAAEAEAARPGFIFAVKASRYLTHMRKLNAPEEGLSRLLTAAEGLGASLGPLLYQLPPHWRVNPERLARFVALLPERRSAFEFRDPSWYTPEVQRILARRGCALVVAVGGALPTPSDLAHTGPFGYFRFHNGQYGIGLSEDELRVWADRIAAAGADGRDVYAYFNNDPGGCAIHDALRLRELLAGQGAALAGA